MLLKIRIKTIWLLSPKTLPQVVQKHKDDQLQRQMQTTVSEVFMQVERAKQEWEATVDALSQLICLLDNKGRVMRGQSNRRNLAFGPG